MKPVDLIRGLAAELDYANRFESSRRQEQAAVLAQAREFFAAHSLYTKAIAKWGQTRQLAKAREECIELALAIEHYLDGRATAEDVAEEAADVEIMSPQVRLIIGGELVDAAKARKLARLRERIEG